MRLSKLLAAEIENPNKKRGYVFGGNLNGDGDIILNCADENEDEFCVLLKNVRTVKDKLTFTKECDADEFSSPVRLGKPVFDCEGNFIGRLSDVVIEKNAVSAIIAGNRKFNYRDVVLSDAVLIKNSIAFIKSDVKKNGKIIIKKGTPLTEEVSEKAQKNGEYVQTKLKSL